MSFRLPHLIFPLLVILICSTPISSQNNFDSKHIEVSLRMIGHEVLLNAGDSTSRVLPIVEENGRYRISFETEFELSPNDLVDIVNNVVSSSDFASNYIVEVEHCDPEEVVYSYEVGELVSADIIPCKSRVLPKSCYNLFFTLKVNEEEMASSNLNVGSYLIEILIGILLVAASGLLIWIFVRYNRKKGKINPNWINLGKYQFDSLNAELIIEEQRIELSTKEADLLLLLYESANKTVERDVILNKVWGDQGDYVGRTLDVFISKLRKKLNFDSQVKIVNVRGVGYKLILNHQD